MSQLLNHSVLLLIFGVVVYNALAFGGVRPVDQVVAMIMIGLALSLFAVRSLVSGKWIWTGGIPGLLILAFFVYACVRHAFVDTEYASRRALIEVALAVSLFFLTLNSVEKLVAAFGQLGFDGAQLLGEVFGLGLAGRQEPLREGLGFNGPEVGDIEPELPAPGDEGGLGHVELVRDGGEGATGGAELDELLLRQLVFHGTEHNPGAEHSAGGRWRRGATMGSARRRAAWSGK